LLQEYSAGWGVDHRGFEMARHDYFLTDEGKEFADAKAQVNADLWGNVQNAAEVIKKAGDLNYMELSIAAKAYFALTKLRGSASLEEIHALLPQFGWNECARCRGSAFRQVRSGTESPPHVHARYR
jgi:hypothetical protein